MRLIDRMHEPRRLHPRTAERKASVTKVSPVLEAVEYRGRRSTFSSAPGRHLG